MVSSRDASALAETGASLRAAGAEVQTEAADITDPAAPGRLVEATMAAFGSVDVVVANAGGPPAGRSLEVDDAMLESALDANFLSAVRLIRAAVPHMREGGWGRICCISSYSVVQPVPTLSLSNAARTALRSWAKTAAQDLAAEGSGITLNLMCPGPHATDRMRELGGSGPWGTLPTSGGWSRFSAPSRPGSSTGPRWSSTAGRPWPCRRSGGEPGECRDGPDPSRPCATIVGCGSVVASPSSTSRASPPLPSMRGTSAPSRC